MAADPSKSGAAFIKAAHIDNATLMLGRTVAEATEIHGQEPERRGLASQDVLGVGELLLSCAASYCNPLLLIADDPHLACTMPLSNHAHPQQHALGGDPQRG